MISNLENAQASVNQNLPGPTPEGPGSHHERPHLVADANQLVTVTVTVRPTVHGAGFLVSRGLAFLSP